MRRNGCPEASLEGLIRLRRRSSSTMTPARRSHEGRRIRGSDAPHNLVRREAAWYKRRLALRAGSVAGRHAGGSPDGIEKMGVAPLPAIELLGKVRRSSLSGSSSRRQERFRLLIVLVHGESLSPVWQAARGRCVANATGAEDTLRHVDASDWALRERGGVQARVGGDAPDGRSGMMRRGTEQACVALKEINHLY